MEKTATLNLRVNPIAKQRAENVLKQLGIPMSTAMDMYLNQIALVGGIPFPVTLPKAPLSVDADRMTDDELIEKLSRGIEDADAGRTRRAEDVFREHRSRRAE
jgi:addiction module RelB/DinJ family antitoxin